MTHEELAKRLGLEPMHPDDLAALTAELERQGRRGGTV